MNKEIIDSVELQPYVSLEDVIKLAVKIKRQQRRGTTRANKPYSSSSTSTYPSKAATKLELKEETTKPIEVDVKGKAKFESSQLAKSRLGHGHIASQCPNKKVMIVLDAIKEIISEEESNQEVEEGEELVAHLKEGELFIIRQNLTMQARKEEEQ